MYGNYKEKSMKKTVKLISVIAAVFLFIVLMVKLFGNGIKLEMVYHGEMEKSHSFRALVIRDETVVTTDKKGILESMVKDGEMVRKNKHIASVYESDIDDEVKNSLNNITRRIEEITKVKEENQSAVVGGFHLESTIDAKIRELMTATEKGDMEKVSQISGELGLLNDKKNAIENGEAMEFIKYAITHKNINLKGLHCHIGSQMFLYEPFKLGGEVMLDFYSELKNTLGLKLEELNLGGGFGIKYVEEDTPVCYEGFIESVSDVIKNKCKEHNIDVPFIYMEPGRSIVGDAGVTLYTAGAIKDIKNVRKYVSIDGGISDNPRYIMYGAEYDAVIANRANEAPSEYVTICGKFCESGDIIIDKAHLPKINTGDIIAIMSTGAYNYSMASNYNRIPRPPVVMVSEGRAKLVVKRETYEDIIKNDIF